MRVSILILGVGEYVAWHYHSAIAYLSVRPKDPIVVETRAPRAHQVQRAVERCTVPPKTAHCAPGEADGPCKLIVLQGIGEYDNVLVGA